MLIIRCPYCLELRHEDELLYGGEIDVVRPADPENAPDALWCDYLYTRTDAKNPIHEKWCCTAGCGQWFQVARNSNTQEILKTARMDEFLKSTKGEACVPGE